MNPPVKIPFLPTLIAEAKARAAKRISAQRPTLERSDDIPERTSNGETARAIAKEVTEGMTLPAKWWFDQILIEALKVLDRASLPPKRGRR